MAFPPLQTERLALCVHALSDIPALMPLKWEQFFDFEMYGKLASGAEHSPTTT
jgi:hypothetical protein